LVVLGRESKALSVARRSAVPRTFVRIDCTEAYH
jgi:hypothetical protein